MPQHFEIDGQVEEVVGAPEVLVDGGQQHLLGVLVGDVLHHQGRASIAACNASHTTEGLSQRI